MSNDMVSQAGNNYRNGKQWPSSSTRHLSDHNTWAGITGWE